jgi:hypothetical protein
MILPLQAHALCVFCVVVLVVHAQELEQRSVGVGQVIILPCQWYVQLERGITSGRQSHPGPSNFPSFFLLVFRTLFADHASFQSRSLRLRLEE